MSRPIRIAARAVILHRDRLLLVNAWANGSDLWCAPGGGAEPHTSLPDNLRREVHEETGLTVQVGRPCLINEFHAPDASFHQVDVYFRCDITHGQTSDGWVDPEGIVSRHIWASRRDMDGLFVKPDSLASVAWGDDAAVSYDPLELLVR